MLYSKGLHKCFWANDICCVNYIFNQIVTKAALQVAHEEKYNGRKHDIQHQKTVPYTPQQNGVAERKNITLVEMARCMLYSKGLHNFFWLKL